MPVIPATQEPDAGELGRQRVQLKLQGAKIHHCTAAWATRMKQERNAISKKEKKETYYLLEKTANKDNTRVTCYKAENRDGKE